LLFHKTCLYNCKHRRNGKTATFIDIDNSSSEDITMAKQIKFTKRQTRKIGARIRAARATRGMTQLELSRIAFGTEVSHCHVSRLERAVQPTVSLQVRLEAVARALNIRPSVLMAA
jgi:hypothetical protein